jgi:hypothetical protein
MQCPKETVASASWTMILAPLGVTHVMPFTYSHVHLRPRYLPQIRCLDHSFVYIGVVWRTSQKLIWTPFQIASISTSFGG